MRSDPVAVAAVAGIRVVAYEIVGSSNREALARARDGDVGPLWITAESQSAGRGRRGREWVSEPGNLYATLLLVDAAPSERAAELAFVAGLAVHDAVAECAPALAAGLALKWPNDLLVDERKFSGILIEGEGAAVAIGIGVNCTHHPVETAFPASDLAAAGASCSPKDLFAALVPAMARRLAQWDRGAGFDGIRADWLARAFRRGKTLRVALTDEECTGMFETIDEHGGLVLRLESGATRTITAGDVFLAPAVPRPAAPAEL